MTESARVRCRLRVSLFESDPEIWRLLDLDGALRLDELHHVIQIAFGWRDSHLHQFVEENPFEPQHAAGREPLRWTMPNVDDEYPGQPESEWTIAATFARLSGPLYYEYDFGDGWIHEIELVEATPDGATQPRAVLVRGENRGPLEDSGGTGGYQRIVAAFADPTHPEHDELSDWVAFTLGSWERFDPTALDIDEVNRELVLRFDAARDAAAPDATMPTGLQELIDRLPGALQREFRTHLRRAGALEPATVDPGTAAQMVHPFSFLIRRVGVEGINLSQAGWMAPAVVSDVVRELGWQSRWIGKMNREDQTPPIRDLRAAAERLGLLRKVRGRLVLTTAAKRMHDDPVRLWEYLAANVSQRHRTQAESDATILLAVEVAAARHESPVDHAAAIVFGLDALNWVSSDGESLDPWDVLDLIQDSWRVFESVGSFEMKGWGTGPVTPGGRAFARAVLQERGVVASR